MTEYRHGNQTVSRLTAHLVWVTKYRYEVLRGDIQLRCRELIIQICDAEDVRILKGVVSKDHVHMPIEYPPKTSLSDLVKRFKGRTSRIHPAGVPAVAEAILGAPLLGHRLRGVEHRQHHGGSGQEIP